MRGRKRFRRRRACRGTPRKRYQILGAWTLVFPGGFALPAWPWTMTWTKEDLALPLQPSEQPADLTFTEDRS